MFRHPERHSFPVGIPGALLLGMLLGTSSPAMGAPKAVPPASGSASEWLGSSSVPSGHQMTGESRLLEPDLSKTFDPALARFGSRPSSSTGRSARISPFGGSKSFGPAKSAALDKSFPSSAFHTPQFLTKSSPTRSFASSAFSGTRPAPEKDSRSAASGNAAPSKTFPSFRSSLASTPATAAQREYAGPEAEKKKIPYTPANGPLGGVTTGRVLSIEEVRDILNKSK